MKLSAPGGQKFEREKLLAAGEAFTTTYTLGLKERIPDSSRFQTRGDFNFCIHSATLQEEGWVTFADTSQL